MASTMDAFAMPSIFVEMCYSSNGDGGHDLVRKGRETEPFIYGTTGSTCPARALLDVVQARGVHNGRLEGRGWLWRCECHGVAAPGFPEDPVVSHVDKVKEGGGSFT